MTTPIQFNSSQPLASFAELTQGSKTAGKDVNQFAQLMLESIGHVNAMQQDANQAFELLTTGGDIQAAEVLTSIQKADMTFRLMLQIRNKLMQAYQEIKEIRI
jgi:flagellar hook-basal body complex protein FliE